MERYQELVGRNKVCFKNCSFDISICPDAILTYGMLSSAVPSCSPAHILYQKKRCCSYSASCGSRCQCAIPLSTKIRQRKISRKATQFTIFSYFCQKKTIFSYYTSKNLAPPQFRTIAKTSLFRTKNLMRDFQREKLPIIYSENVVFCFCA